MWPSMARNVFLRGDVFSAFAFGCAVAWAADSIVVPAAAAAAKAEELRKSRRAKLIGSGLHWGDMEWSLMVSSFSAAGEAFGRGAWHSRETVPQHCRPWHTVARPLGEGGKLLADQPCYAAQTRPCCGIGNR